MQFQNAKIIVFAKTPVAGKVKTRLIPALGAEGAKDFHCRMLEHTLKAISKNRIAQVELHCSPYSNDPYLQTLASEHDIQLRLQQGNNLGERMSFALHQILTNCDHAILIGTDCPALNSDYIQQALEILATGTDVIMGPADDGGYVLIGLNSSHPELFSHIDWGSDKVLQQTIDKIQSLGLNYRQLDSLSDIDTPEDIEYLKSNGQFAHLLSN